MSSQDHESDRDDLDFPALEELQALARATDDVAPSAGFTDAIMAAVEAENAQPVIPSPRGWEADVLRWGRSALAVAAVAAAAAVFISVRAESAFDEEVLATVDLVEVVE
jgi:hypothetical protein